jgi:hypothetical protein
MHYTMWFHCAVTLPLNKQAKSSAVTPAEAGVQHGQFLDSRLRGNDS